jgi:hypothetical protein
VSLRYPCKRFTSQSVFTAAVPAADFPSVLRKEALYCAVGRCAHRLRELSGLDDWINQSLTAEALDPNPTYRIIKRRIAWLFGRWFAEGNVTNAKGKVYEVLVHLIQAQEGSDAVVRLTAATALKDCVNVSHTHCCCWVDHRLKLSSQSALTVRHSCLTCLVPFKHCYIYW